MSQALRRIYIQLHLLLLRQASRLLKTQYGLYRMVRDRIGSLGKSHRIRLLDLYCGPTPTPCACGTKLVSSFRKPEEGYRVPSLTSCWICGGQSTASSDLSNTRILRKTLSSTGLASDFTDGLRLITSGLASLGCTCVMASLAVCLCLTQALVRRGSVRSIKRLLKHSWKSISGCRIWASVLLKRLGSTIDPRR